MAMYKSKEQTVSNEGKVKTGKAKSEEKDTQCRVQWVVTSASNMAGDSVDGSRINCEVNKSDPCFFLCRAGTTRAVQNKSSRQPVSPD